MGAITLELRYPQTINGISINPQPNWSFDTLISELNSIDDNLNSSSSKFPLHFTKLQSQRKFLSAKANERKSKAFIMRVSDDELEELEINGEEREPSGGQELVVGTRFSCDQLSYLSESDDSEDESTLGIQFQLMDRVGLVEGALSELTHEHQLSLTEEIRNQILALEIDLTNENEKFTSALVRIEKYIEAQREMDRRLDVQYQRKIAEALDNHLTAVQRDHEHRSQIEERKIRDAAALEEAKRKEKALQEEKFRQERIKAEAEVQARLEAERKRDEEAKVAALEAERRAEKEAAEKVASENSRKVAAATVASKDALQSTGNSLKATESAIKLEERRLQTYKELVAKNAALGLGSNKEFRSHGMQIARRIKTISGSKEIVRSKAHELINICLSSPYPQSISIQLFAEKVVSLCVNPTGSFSNAAFAYGRVIVMVASQVPLAMDILVAELNRVCIYTVPKYLSYSESTFETKEVHCKAIGYYEEDGKLENTDSYVERLSSYMKLYGALVQTEVEGVQNMHGLKEGWAWLARFLNALPANLYTAVALHSFLEMAGFTLYRKYKTQFNKLVKIISRDFLSALRARGDPKLNKIIMNIQTYLDSNQFLKEPEGWRLQNSLLSDTFVPE